MFTVTAVLPAMLPNVAVMFALPGETGTTTAGFPGISNTVATDIFDEAQLTWEVRSKVLPSAKLPVAVRI